MAALIAGRPQCHALLHTSRARVVPPTQRGSVGGQFGRAQPRHKRAGTACHGSNFRVVNGNQNFAYFGNDFFTASTSQAIKGLLPSSSRFFLSIRREWPRAGTKASIFTLLEIRAGLQDPPRRSFPSGTGCRRHCPVGLQRRLCVRCSHSRRGGAHHLMGAQQMSVQGRRWHQALHRGGWCRPSRGWFWEL